MTKALKSDVVPLVVASHVCVAADRYRCLVVRYGVSMDLARCLLGCSCGCHDNTSYEQLSQEAWQEK